MGSFYDGRNGKTPIKYVYLKNLTFGRIMMFGLTTKEVKVTDTAIEYLKQQMSEDMAGIRFMILTGKGCGGNEYDIKPVLKGEESDKDEILEVEDGLTLFIPKTDVLRFFGVEIDFITDSLGSRRIAIKNPNETARCGCGESVSF